MVVVDLFRLVVVIDLFRLAIVIDLSFTVNLSFTINLSFTVNLSFAVDFIIVRVVQDLYVYFYITFYVLENNMYKDTIMAQQGNIPIMPILVPGNHLGKWRDKGITTPYTIHVKCKGIILRYLTFFKFF